MFMETSSFAGRLGRFSRRQIITRSPISYAFLEAHDCGVFSPVHHLIIWLVLLAWLAFQSLWGLGGYPLYGPHWPLTYPIVISDICSADIVTIWSDLESFKLKIDYVSGHAGTELAELCL
jgi:hypothetical protein